MPSWSLGLRPGAAPGLDAAHSTTTARWHRTKEHRTRREGRTAAPASDCPCRRSSPSAGRRCLVRRHRRPADGEDRRHGQSARALPLVTSCCWSVPSRSGCRVRPRSSQGGLRGAARDHDGIGIRPQDSVVVVSGSGKPGANAQHANGWPSRSCTRHPTPSRRPRWTRTGATPKSSPVATTAFRREFQRGPRSPRPPGRVRWPPSCPLTRHGGAAGLTEHGDRYRQMCTSSCPRSLGAPPSEVVSPRLTAVVHDRHLTESTARSGTSVWRWTWPSPLSARPPAHQVLYRWGVGEPALGRRAR